MRRSIILFSALFLLICSLGCCHRSGRLVGTWEMVFPGQAPPRGESVDESPGDTPIKILNDSHFAFGSVGPYGMVYAGGGRYTLEGETYTEVITYHFDPKLVGKSVSFTCRLDGDRWYHSGIFEVDGEHYHIEEIWRRIK
jgi:hypothetical protein